MVVVRCNLLRRFLKKPADRSGAVAKSLVYDDKVKMRAVCPLWALPQFCLLANREAGTCS